MRLPDYVSAGLVCEEVQPSASQQARQKHGDHIDHVRKLVAELTFMALLCHSITSFHDGSGLYS